MSAAEPGRFLVGQFGGTYVLQLEGDVRVTLCSAIDCCLEQIFAAGNVRAVIIDLSRTTGMDSTTLGLLAKLGLYVKKRFGVRAVMANADASMARLLQGVGFDQIFHIETRNATAVTTQTSEMPVVNISEAETRDKVLEAHRILMSLNEENRAAFADLVRYLEKQC